MRGLPAGADPGAATALLPFSVAALMAVAVHACYIVSASLGHVEWCFPYLEGCTTISRASRAEPEVFIYRVMITSSAVLMIPYWRTTAILHGLLGAGSQPALRRAFTVFGVVAAVMLAVNAALIGSELELAKQLRRICVLGFFFGVFAAVALSTVSLARLRIQRLRGALAVKAACAALMLVVGAFNYAVLPFVPALAPHEDALQNAIEWNWVALLCVFFFTSVPLWRGARLSPHWTASA